MGETMRERLEKAGELTGGVREMFAAFADHADAMALRLAALERGATVETKPATVAVAPKVWPVGSKPPPGVGQVRRGDDGFTYRIVCVLPVSPCAAIRTDRGWLDLCGVAILAGAPLLEPWTEPAATPADPRIAELESRIRELEAKNHAQGVEWRAAEDRCREANERARDAIARNNLLTAERDAAVKRAEGADGARVERVAVDTTHIPNPVAPGSVVCPNCERDITLSAHAGASEGA